MSDPTTQQRRRPDRKKGFAVMAAVFLAAAVIWGALLAVRRPLL